MDIKLRNRLILGAVVVAVSSAIGVAVWRSYADQKAREEQEKKCLQAEAQLAESLTDFYALGAKGRSLEQQQGRGTIQFTILLPEVEDNLNEMRKIQDYIGQLQNAYKKECGEARATEWMKNNFERLRLAGDPGAGG
jgi:hypothetical protein